MKTTVMHHLIQKIRTRISGKIRPWTIVAALAALLYCRTLAFHYTFYDDTELISAVRDLPGSILAAFTSALHSRFDLFYQPVMHLSILIDSFWSGGSPAFFHLTNIVIHCLAACLVVTLLTRLRYGRRIALFSGLLFAAHPALVMAVAWIPGRNDSLFGLFTTCAFILLIDHIRSPGGKTYWLHLLFFALALFTKETAVMLGPVFALYLLFVERQDLRKMKLLAAGWLSLYLLWGTLRSVALKHSMPSAAVSLNSVGSGAIALLQYIGKALFPFALSPLPTVRDTGIAAGIIASLSIVMLLLASPRKRYPHIVFGASWFVLMFLPTLLLNNNGLYFEHRSYVPFIGILIVLSETAGAVQRFPVPGRFLLGGGAAVVALFSILTLQYAGSFSNRLAFWQNAVWRSPHSDVAHANLGLVHLERKEYAKASGELNLSLTLNRNNADAHNNLGLLYVSLGNTARAAAHFERAITLDNRHAGAYSNLANYYCSVKRYDAAANLLEKALNINPHFAEALYNRGNIFLARGDFGPAIEYYRRSISAYGSTSSDSLDCRFNLGIAYYRSAQYEKALKQFSAIQTADPRFDPALGRLIADCAARTRAGGF